MIGPSQFTVVCDVSGCGMSFTCLTTDERVVRRTALAAGWALSRRKDGGIAWRGGKDYCPRHFEDRSTGD